MATTIRLKRVGAKKEASYRIIVTDSREGTSGAAIERLGTYNPRTRPSMIRVNAARTLHWLNEGAEPSDTVRSLLRKTGVWKQFHDGATGETLEEEVVFLGPPEGERGTSQRPMPTDRAPKVGEVAPLFKGGHDRKSYEEIDFSNTDPVVRFDNDVSDSFTVIDVFAADRQGLLYKITDTLWQLNLHIYFSRIATNADQVVDVFYIKNQDGAKITDPEQKESVRQQLMSVLTEDTGVEVHA